MANVCFDATTPKFLKYLTDGKIMKTNKNNSVEFFYIGNDFYWKSGMSMSSLYVDGTCERGDWGMVERIVKEGNTVSIRPATDQELLAAYKLLDKITKEK